MLSFTLIRLADFELQIYFQKFCVTNHCAMEMSDCIWQQQEYARPETCRSTLVGTIPWFLYEDQVFYIVYIFQEPIERVVGGFAVYKKKPVFDQ